VFEPVAAKRDGGPSGLRQIPQPFILEPPLEEKTDYSPGDTLAFDFVLVGRAIRYLPYFLTAFELMGIQGIGKGKGRYQVTKMLRVSAAGIATDLNLRDLSLDGDGHEPTMLRDLEQIQPRPAPFIDVGLHFLTPTRLKFDRHLCDSPEFHVVFRNLARRLSLLSFFHCDGTWEERMSDAVKNAQAIRLVRNGLEWKDWRRYSNRQEKEMFLGGFTGHLGFHGELEPFWSHLLLGSYLHIGKGATFGLGKYEIKTSNSTAHNG
jgi:hypothetical protein